MPNRYMPSGHHNVTSNY